jgi:hypothetical protein
MRIWIKNSLKFWFLVGPEEGVPGLLPPAQPAQALAPPLSQLVQLVRWVPGSFSLLGILEKKLGFSY